MTLKIIKLSLRTIYNNKMCSFLTMLGIIIGVMAVVILVSITPVSYTHLSFPSPSQGDTAERTFIIRSATCPA